MNNRGFSLVEMMIALVVMAILLTVALPNYQQFARESRRADGKAALLGLQMAQEKLRANCRFYAGSVGNTNTCGADAANSTVDYPAVSTDGYYNIAVSAASGNSFTITADPKGAQAADTDCDPMQIQFPAGTRTPAACWN